MGFATIALFVQLFFGIIIGVYFWNLLKSQRSQKTYLDKESKVELEKMKRLRDIRLTEPLAEKVRPKHLSEVVGQEDGLKTLRMALCGPNPQHVIIYGPPGVGKTAAARLVLDEAKRQADSPFRSTAAFVELDGATSRFDERGIADPLIGSVHDPIYQGAGSMGQAGIPQPKPGAVTKAHGGILFIDEIGELHTIQQNKLLKVLEDRKVFLESAYYSSENEQIPSHIHDIFKRGLPADFRLVAATTRQPEEMPPAIRSRCLEVFFRALDPDEIVEIAKRAADKAGMALTDDAAKKVADYATNGRETVNVVQIAVGAARADKRTSIEKHDIEWVLHSSQMSPRPERRIHEQPAVGLVNGLAVTGPNSGALLEIEVLVQERAGNGTLTITGIAEEEQSGSQMRSIKRKSMARSSVENVITVLKRKGLPTSDYDIHVNFPGGTPVDGPSAGIAIATGIYSGIKQTAVSNEVAMTGELSVHGKVRPIGGVIAKVKAAKQAGAKRIIIPKENEQALLKTIEGITIHPVKTFDEVLELALVEEKIETEAIPASAMGYDPSPI
ncbi:ATP-dependent protease LonB [Shouchella clausii]|jgi:ATP-dependent Lon protease|uniref:endopeptidase La n=1 Tax=Shouchella clausii TaxID=79880 RepID=A0A268S2W1_SHOCL|nr:ATP-dependent protease LonB [Shouchella clausii]PAD41915.1 ATP-dependent protease LonB [Bacillus sp. 7520-S]AST97099.1 ATP-dependent protease LonB [Shouchella clausii]MCR1286600.1 ATP-dependent protease LonB [Shouchella clausii]MEB5473877.1 ATP-dependent protease LonB [Shouchella clausii]MEB5478299.1 ATP-dependent protease LonB [Shouchella clausii]